MRTNAVWTLALTVVRLRRLRRLPLGDAVIVLGVCATATRADGRSRCRDSRPGIAVGAA